MIHVLIMYQVGMIPAQTQLQTALSISLGSEGKAVSCHLFLFLVHKSNPSMFSYGNFCLKPYCCLELFSKMILSLDIICVMYPFFDPNLSHTIILLNW